VVVARGREAQVPVRGARIGLFAPGLVGRRVAAGDCLRAWVCGAGLLDLRILQTLPAGPVVVTPATVLLVAGRCHPPISHPCVRPARLRSARGLSWV
jgi:hypothetical protein